MLFPTVKHSPATDTEADSIFYIATDGGAYISDYISTYSYGSPDTGNRLNPCLIMLRGNVGGYNFSIFVYDSYGALRSPDIRYNTAWWVGLNGVCDSWMHDGVTYSYGTLRTRMVPTTLGLSTLLAASTTSTTTTAVSTIPTAAFSPGTGFANQGMVYAVRSNGNVNIAYPDDSYGLFYHHSYIIQIARKEQ